MSSGRTHDKITLICLPIVCGLSMSLTRNAESTLWIGGSFLFGGLMFGPDLDIRSNQSSRWGWFRWIWLPYRRAIPHRSIFSHGPIVGTFFRLLYISFWLISGALLYLILRSAWGWPTWNGQQIWQSLRPTLMLISPKLFVIFIGLEIGAMSHYLADFFSSLGKKVLKPHKKAGRSRKSRSSRNY